MTKYFLLYLWLTLPCNSQTQSKDTLEKYITNTLSYQHIKYNSSGKDSLLVIRQIKFDQCTMSYSIFKKNKNKTERFTVRIFFPGISKISMAKNKEGYYVITFTTKGKSIVKEYPDGKLIHVKTELIPLKTENWKALHYLEKLNQICLSRK